MAQAVTTGYKNFAYLTSNEPWEIQVEPFRVGPRAYYIGNKWVGAYLLDGGSELELIDTCMFGNVYLTLEAVRKLGFDPHDIKNIFLSHCHVDHSGGARAIQEYTGASIWLSEIDAEFNDSPANQSMGGKDHIWPAYKADKFYEDDKIIQAGDLEIRTKLTPGHTPGTTSFFVTMPEDNGNKLVMAMHGGVGVLTMKKDFLEKYNLPMNLPQRFIEDCEKMKSIHVDITVSSHPAHFDLFSRCSENPMDYSAFVNDGDWAEFLKVRAEFAKEIL